MWCIQHHKFTIIIEPHLRCYSMWHLVEVIKARLDFQRDQQIQCINNVWTNLYIFMNKNTIIKWPSAISIQNYFFSIVFNALMRTVLKVYKRNKCLHFRIVGPNKRYFEPLVPYLKSFRPGFKQFVLNWRRNCYARIVVVSPNQSMMAFQFANKTNSFWSSLGGLKIPNMANEKLIWLHLFYSIFLKIMKQSV